MTVGLQPCESLPYDGMIALLTGLQTVPFEARELIVHPLVAARAGRPRMDPPQTTTIARSDSKLCTSATEYRDSGIFPCHAGKNRGVPMSYVAGRLLEALFTTRE